MKKDSKERFKYKVGLLIIGLTLIFSLLALFNLIA